MQSETDGLRATSPSRRKAASHRRHELFVAVAFIAAVTCFVASTTYIDQSVSEISEGSQLVSEALFPRVIELLDMRADLRQVARLVSENHERSDLRSAIIATLDHAEASRRRYEAAESGRQLDGPWTAFRSALGGVASQALAVCTRQEHGEAIDEARTNLYAWLDRADESLAKVASTNRDEVQRHARRVAAVRTRVGRSAYALDALSALIAGAFLVQAVRALRRDRLAMETQVDELEVFVARVAHDLRTPLGPAMFALKQALARTGDGQLRNQIERGARSLHTIERMVSGLFAFAASGAAPEPGATAPLRETLEEVVAERIDSASAGGIRLSLDCRGDALVACSAGVLASIVGNLLDNAVKYVGEGERRQVEVRAFPYPRDTRIEVSDTGPGVPPEDRSRIFEPYVRRRTGGSGIGLGLATVKRLATRHGGHVGVTGAWGGGSTFWVELPVVRSRDGERRHVNRGEGGRVTND
jgi:signal transduction histidine kinase